MKRSYCSALLLCISLLILAQPDSYDFRFPVSQAGKAPLLDLRYLNENFAGEHGFIRLSADGKSFVRADQIPIRFWPVNTTAGDMSDSAMQVHARFLAQLGVNMIRIHTAINPKGKGQQIWEPDREEIRNIWRIVSIMKKEGIYTSISPYWPHNGHSGGWLPEEWGIDGYSGKDDLWGVIYFNDRLQEAYKGWVKALYTETNPYTGIALKDEPAVALIQIMNEDGVFFWTMQNMRPSLKKMVQEKYRVWLKKRYGSIGSAFQAWGIERLPGDDPVEGMIDLYSTYEITQPAKGERAIRMRDQVEFYADTQFDFYQGIHAFYRNVLQCKQLVNAMNWTTASQARLMDLERWTNSSCEVIALNRYYDPGHFGENAGWRIDAGHYYTGLSVLKQPGQFPLNIRQVSGHPMLITESGWNLPHKYTAEGPFLVAAYGSLTGLDGFYWFSADAPMYNEDPYYGFLKNTPGKWAMQRWTCSLPGILGQFPANALLYRMGYLKEGIPSLQEEKPLSMLWNRELSPLAEEQNYDPNRDEKYVQADKPGETLSALSYLAGPVEVQYEGEAAQALINPDLGVLIQEQEKKVSSSTGELEWNYGEGICTMDASRAQGVCGFLGTRKQFVLGDVTIRSTNDYAAVLLVSMDGKPIRESGKLLLQTGTSWQPSDWKEEEVDFEREGQPMHGYRILNTGHMPWRAAATEVSLEIENAQINRAMLLDAGGYLIRSLKLQKNKGKLLLQLPRDAMYVLLEKAE